MVIFPIHKLKIDNKKIILDDKILPQVMECNLTYDFGYNCWKANIEILVDLDFEDKVTVDICDSETKKSLIEMIKTHPATALTSSNPSLRELAEKVLK